MFIYCICTQYLVLNTFCFNYCLNSAWHECDQFVALLMCYGSPGFFDSGLQLICIFLVSCFSLSSWQYPIDSLWGSGLVILQASQAHQHHGHLTNFGAFGSVGRCQILLENEVSIFKKLVSRKKHEVLKNVLVNGCSDVGFQKTQMDQHQQMTLQPKSSQTVET